MGQQGHLVEKAIGQQSMTWCNKATMGQQQYHIFVNSLGQQQGTTCQMGQLDNGACWSIANGTTIWQTWNNNNNGTKVLATMA